MGETIRWAVTVASLLAVSLTTGVAGASAPEEPLATFETRYHDYGRLRGRAWNVELATLHLAGAEIAPGAEFSFNEHVGERSREAGFRMAPVIDGGQLRRGLGGGVCQVASTLYAAALHAGLEVVEHRPHSRPSGYIRRGFDAMVSYGQVDLRLRNPHPFPIRVQASAGAGHLRVELLGDGPVAPVEVRAVVVKRLEASERRVPDSGVTGVVVEAEGRDGFVVLLTRSGPAISDRRTVRYGAAERIVRVPAGSGPLARR